MIPMIRVIGTDGEALYQPGFIAAERAEALFRRLVREVPWQDEVLADAGRRVQLPRAVCWYGEAGYPYAGFSHAPQLWTEPLLDLKQAVERACGQGFNGALVNGYRHGGEAMGWHADCEAVLGENPVIASVSLGAERLMRFRHNHSGEEVELSLASGSLLVMRGRLQHCWQHAVPGMAGLVAGRVNLNFRYLLGNGLEP